MTKKEIKKQEEYLSRQSEILNESLDFWQIKTLEQVKWVEETQGEPKEDFSSFEEDYDEEFLPQADKLGRKFSQREAAKELDYCMMKLQWENSQMNDLDNKIQYFLKEKNK